VSFGGLPRGVAAPYGPGTLAVVVVDTAGCVLRVVDATGQFLASAGSKGSGSGSLLRPTGVGADGSGTLYVVDAGNARVSVWDPGSVERVDVFLDLASDPRTWGATVLLAIGAGLAIWTIRASRNAPPAV
jgi:DNA-binding beta-propeller fold protein YncE